MTEEKIEITIAEVEERLPQVRQWHQVVRRIEQAANEMHLPNGSLWDRVELLISEAKRAGSLTAMPLQVQTTPNGRREIPDLTAEEQVLYLFRTHTDEEFTATDVADHTGLHETTVRKYLDLYTRTGDLTSRLDKPKPGRRGRLPRLYKYNTSKGG